MTKNEMNTFSSDFMKQIHILEMEGGLLGLWDVANMLLEACDVLLNVQEEVLNSIYRAVVRNGVGDLMAKD